MPYNSVMILLNYLIHALIMITLSVINKTIILYYYRLPLFYIIREILSFLFSLWYLNLVKIEMYRGFNRITIDFKYIVNSRAGSKKKKLIDIKVSTLLRIHPFRTCTRICYTCNFVNIQYIKCRWSLSHDNYHFDHVISTRIWVRNKAKRNNFARSWTFPGM